VRGRSGRHIYKLSAAVVNLCRMVEYLASEQQRRGGASHATYLKQRASVNGQLKLPVGGRAKCP
jgi:hypothetical protein